MRELFYCQILDGSSWYVASNSGTSIGGVRLCREDSKARKKPFIISKIFGGWRCGNLKGLLIVHLQAAFSFHFLWFV